MPPRQQSKKQHKKKQQHQHHFYFSSDALIDSCPLPISNIIITNTTNGGGGNRNPNHNPNHNRNHVLTVEADVSMKLSEYIKKSKIHMEYSHAEKMIHCIGNQLQKLEAKDYGIPSFNLDDITVFFIKNEKPYGDDEDDEDGEDEIHINPVDSKLHDQNSKKNIIYDTDYEVYFAITNDDKVCEFSSSVHRDDVSQDAASDFPVHTYQELVIVSPFKKEYVTQTSTYQKNKAFISPEFETFTNMKELPYHIHFKSGYYSFGLLCIYCLLTRKRINMHEIKGEIAQKEIQDNIINSDRTTSDRTTSGGGNKADEISITSALQTIINTKIYWFLIRVLKRDASARRYICV
jgi:hypothetical protein